MTVAFCGALGWGLSATAGLGPDFGEPTVQSVPAGETVPATTLTFGDRPGFYKTGAGTLAVDAGRIARTTDGRLTVLEGAVAVTAGAAADLTTPPAVCDKAAFWVNETSVVVTGSVASAEGGGGTPPGGVTCANRIRLRRRASTPSRNGAAVPITPPR